MAQQVLNRNQFTELLYNNCIKYGLGEEEAKYYSDAISLILPSSTYKSANALDDTVEMLMHVISDTYNQI